jgi:hypothetical protein
MDKETIQFLLWLLAMTDCLAFVACFWPMVIKIMELTSKNKINHIWKK